MAAASIIAAQESANSRSQKPMTNPDDVPLPQHTPLCRNDWCDGRCVQEMMSRLEREHSERTRRGNAYRKLMGK
jgi:hypothetical protein